MQEVLINSQKETAAESLLISLSLFLIDFISYNPPTKFTDYLSIVLLDPESLLE